MERIGFSSGGNKVRERLEIENNLKFDKDYPYGYPWPPRYYTCSFCQREFKSAQALGGHMNIHRRDRARLRDLSPPPSTTTTTNIDDQNPNFNSNPNPNPNPNSYPNPNPNIDDQNPNLSHPSSTSSSNIYTHQYSLVSLSLSSLPPPIMNRSGEKHGSTIMGSIDGFGRDYYEQRVGKWKYMSSSCEHHHENGVRLDLNNNYNGVSTKEIVGLDLELCLGEAKEDLDLELRLGI